MEKVQDFTKNVGSIYALNIALFIRAMQLLSPIILLFYKENGLGVKELFLFQGVFYLVSILIEIPVGYIADLCKKKYILMFSFSSFLLATVLWYLFHGYYIILTGEILFAISKVTMDTASSSYLYEYLNVKDKEKKMPSYWGYLNFYLAGGTAVGALLGTYLYVKYKSGFLLICEMVIMCIALLLLSFIRTIPSSKKTSFHKKHVDFIRAIRRVVKNDDIKYYMLYSGTLTAMSVLFAFSFQPLMQKSLFPAALFGIVAFTNHGIRSLAGFFVGTVGAKFNLYKMRIPLFILDIFAFILIFIINGNKNVDLNFSLLFVICLIIGAQLVFTMIHMSRLHKLVHKNYRGITTSINNFIPRIFLAIILLSSKFFISKTGLTDFFIFYFIIFLVGSSYLIVKTENIRN